MFSATVWKKYLVRVIKIVTMVFLCHQVLNAKLLGSSSKDHKLLYTINSIVCISAGAFNTYLMYSSLSGDYQKKWLYFNYFKLATALIVFTPIFSFLPFSKNAKVDIQFYWAVMALILSPMARYYRESCVMRQNQKKEKEATE